MQEMYLILSYFDFMRGPLEYISIPKHFPETRSDIERKIISFFSLNLDNDFFEINLVEDHLKTINLYFEIDSPWARGQKEMAILTILTDKNYKDLIFFNLLEELSDKINQETNIFKAFYKGKEEAVEDAEVNQKYERLLDLLKIYYKKIKETAESAILGNLLILGLHKVGKTTIIKRLKENVFSPHVKPTLAITLIELIMESYKFTVIDVSGQKRLRSQWWEYTKTPDSIIFVLDIIDVMNAGERLGDTQKEFKKILEKFSEKDQNSIALNTPFLICINKIDLVENLTLMNGDVIRILGLERFKGNTKIQFTSAIQGVGIEDGFKWLVSEMIKIS